MTVLLLCDEARLDCRPEVIRATGETVDEADGVWLRIKDEITDSIRQWLR